MDNITTSRLSLRSWKEQDLESLAKFYSDKDSAQYVGGQKDRNEAWLHLAALIGHWQLKGFGYWAVDEIITGDFVGAVGLLSPEGWPEVELGYWLVNEYQGKGYAREAAIKSKQYARDILKLDSLVSYIDPNNTPSIKLAESSGARYEKPIELLNEGTHCVYRYL
jgi:RimJ/RimL family protein N-acetyltransferase